MRLGPPHTPVRSCLLPALIAACGGDGDRPVAIEQADRTHYQDGVTRGNPQDRLEHCRAIDEPVLRSDCLTALAPRAAALEALTVVELCDEIEVADWRDECFFVAAERARMVEDPAGAAALCGQAGRFSRDCSNHLWQRELRDTLHPGGVQNLVEHHEQAQAIHDHWASAFTQQVDFDTRFWEHCYQVAFERTQFLDIRACERVPALEQETCQTSAETTYRAWLNQALDRRGGRKEELWQTDGATLLPSQATILLETARTPDHPRLIAVLRDFHTARCSATPKPPEAG